MKKRNNKKALSPVIATVLLIALVVAIGAIVFVWFRGMTQTSVEKSGKNIDLVCQEVEFKADYSEGLLLITNTGTIPIYDIKLKIIEDGSHTTKSLMENSPEWQKTGLNQQESFSGSVSLGDSEEIELMPVLLAESDKGEVSWDCENNVQTLIIS